jgi:hypothetical protein
LHRKDLAQFVVDEGIREHAAEFAMVPAIADLYTHERIASRPYSERFAWQQHSYDPLTHSIAQYHKASPSWVFVQALSGGLDGRRTLAHAGLVRRYMARCGTWRSSYRLVLALVQELPIQPHFTLPDLNMHSPDDRTFVEAEARWDIFFARLGGIQEYGFHAGLEPLMWATDELNGALSTLDWSALQIELEEKTPDWTDFILKHAQDEGTFFPSPLDSEVSETDEP